MFMCVGLSVYGRVGVGISGVYVCMYVCGCVQSNIKRKSKTSLLGQAYLIDNKIEREGFLGEHERVRF